MHLRLLLKKTNPESMTDSEIDELKAGKEKLMESAQGVFQKMYEQAQAQGAAGAGPDMGAAGAGTAKTGNAGADDVVDGDYREV